MIFPIRDLLTSHKMSWYFGCLLIITTKLVSADDRIASFSTYIPPCYWDASPVILLGSDSTLQRCNNPLYSTCKYGNDYLCCGPAHYCCNDSSSCCLKGIWTGYEIAGITCGIIAWTFILIVCLTYLAPYVIRAVRRYRLRKIVPAVVVKMDVLKE